MNKLEISVDNSNLYDKKLNPILESSSNEDLAPLVEYLEKKFSQLLTGDPKFIMYQPNHLQYTDIIASEIRNMGGNSFSNLFRGFVGPSYYEIVCDVADKLKAPYKQFAEISVIEKAILGKIFKKALDSMTEEEKKKLLTDIQSSDMNFGGLTTSSLVVLFEAGGFYSYQLAVIIANQMANFVLGHGLSFTANAALTKSLSVVAGPIGWAVCAMWTAIDIAGPAYSVTIPCVVHIAMLRMKANSRYCISCTEILLPNSKDTVCAKCNENKVAEDVFNFEQYKSSFLYKMYEKNNNLEGFKSMMQSLKNVNKIIEDEKREIRKQKKIEIRNKKKEKRKENDSPEWKKRCKSCFR